MYSLVGTGGIVRGSLQAQVCRRLQLKFAVNGVMP